MSTTHAEVPAPAAQHPAATQDQYYAEAQALMNGVLAFDKTGSSESFNGLMTEWQNINDKEKTTPGYAMGVANESAKMINQSDDPLMPTAVVTPDGSMSFTPSLANSLGSHLTDSMMEDVGVKGNLTNLYAGGEGAGMDQANYISYGVMVGTGGEDGSSDSLATVGS